MTNARRISTKLMCLMGIHGCAVSLTGMGIAAMAAAPGGSPALGVWGHAWIPAGAVLALALAAALLPFPRALIEAAGYRLSTARFLRRAEALPSGGERAVVVVRVPELARLPAAKGRRAMKSLQFYLDGFVREGELFGRLDRFAYALLLATGDGEAFSQRLEILKQDAGFLYMAAYPGMRITARVTACRESGQGLADALRSAQSRSAPEGPDHG